MYIYIYIYIFIRDSECGCGADQVLILEEVWYSRRAISTRVATCIRGNTQINRESQ